MTSDTPPPYLRADVTEVERHQIESLLGPLADDSLLRAVRDGRGLQFQRLEFLGDSALDVVLAVHGWIEPECPSCASNPALSEASDAHLTEVAQRVGLGGWLEWRASPERIADLVETCVAACWLSGRWAQVTPFVRDVIHPVASPTTQALAGGSDGAPGRAGRRMASTVLELAAAHGLYLAMPDADEGALSTARAGIHRASAIAAHARRIGEVSGRQVGSGDDDTVLSQVEDALAVVMAQSGADACLAAAAQFVPVASS